MPPDKIKILLGQRVRRLRLLKNLTQARLAEDIGLSTNYISQIETGIASPTFETLVKLTQGLETTLKDLFDFSELGYSN